MEAEASSSLILSRTLDALDLTDDHVQSRVSMYGRLGILANAVDFQPDHQTTFITGSLFDGVCWKGYMTDIDSMLRFSYVSITENGKEVKCPDTHHIFELDHDNVYSGYAKLKLLKEGPRMENNIFSLTPNGAKSYCNEIEGDFYLSSWKFKSAFNRYQVIPERSAWVMQSSYNYAVEFPDDEEILEHGPSLCFTDKTKEEPLHDSVPCFHCQTWPSQASEWITRNRQDWPPQKTIQSIVSKGFDVVPVGSRGSMTRHLEWRLSFTLAERQLLRTFNNTQHKCYSLLKMLLKEVIDEAVPAVLSSFQMKNALLWTIESTEKELWCDERITEAFMACVKTLHGFVSKKYAPSYFISKNNVLENRIDESEHAKLMPLFDGFLKEGWKCLLRCKSLTTGTVDLKLSLKQYQDGVCLDDVLKNICQCDVTSIWIQHDMSLFPRYEGARLELMSQVGESDCLSATIVRHHMMLAQLEERSVDDFFKEVFKPLVAAVQSSLGSHLFAFYKENENYFQKGKRDILQQAEDLLLKGIKSDGASGKLKYASYLYMTGNVQTCLQIAKAVIDNEHRLSVHDPHFLPSAVGPTPDEIKNYGTYLRDHPSTGLEERFLSSVYHAVVFLPTELESAPDAVKFQIRSPLPEPLQYTSWLSWALYDSVVFAHYLVFLCEQKAGREDEATKALLSIESLVEGTVGYEVSALNLLGYSYIMMKNLDKGIPFLLKAMNKSVMPNSTVWQMGSTLADLPRTRSSIDEDKN